MNVKITVTFGCNLPPMRAQTDTVDTPVELLDGYEPGYQEGWNQALVWAGLEVRA